MKKVTLEDYAKFVVEKFHKGKKYDFEKVGTSICIKLKILNEKKEVIGFYLVCPTGMLVSKDSKPFYSKLMEHYKNINTKPLHNYYFAYLLVDEDFKPLDIQRFKIPKNSTLLE